MAHQLPLSIITHTSSFSSQDGALLSAWPLGIQGEQLRASTCHRYFCGFVFRQMQQGESDKKTLIWHLENSLYLSEYRGLGSLHHVRHHKLQFHFKVQNLHARISDSTVTFLAHPLKALSTQTSLDLSVLEGPGCALYQLPTWCFITAAAALCNLLLNPSSEHFLLAAQPTPNHINSTSLEYAVQIRLPWQPRFCWPSWKNTNFRSFHWTNAIITVYKYWGVPQALLGC